MTLTEWMDTICRLSCKERKILTKSDLVDQPRSLRIIITEICENNNNMTACTRYHEESGLYRNFSQSAYKIEFDRLQYLIKLLNGDLVIKIDIFEGRDDFILNTIYSLVTKLRSKRPINLYYSQAQQ